MELTSNPDILRVAAFGTKFFVNGLEMEFLELSDKSDDQWVYLSAETDGVNDYGWVHVRNGKNATDDYRAVFEVEELITALKTGNFRVC